MQGMTPRDNPVTDFLSGLLAWIVWPFVRASWRQEIRKVKDEHSKRELPEWPATAETTL